jgi:hypothetical protein
VAFQRVAIGRVVAQKAPCPDVAPTVASESEPEPALHGRQFSLTVELLMEAFNLPVELLKFIGAEAAIQATTEGTSDDFCGADKPVRIPVVGRIRAFSPIHGKSEVLSLLAAESDAAHSRSPLLIHPFQVPV